METSSGDVRLQVQQGNDGNGQVLELTSRPADYGMSRATTESGIRASHAVLPSRLGRDLRASAWRWFEALDARFVIFDIMTFHEPEAHSDTYLMGRLA